MRLVSAAILIAITTLFGTAAIGSTIYFPSLRTCTDVNRALAAMERKEADKNAQLDGTTIAQLLELRGWLVGYLSGFGSGMAVKGEETGGTVPAEELAERNQDFIREYCASHPDHEIDYAAISLAAKVMKSCQSTPKPADCPQVPQRK